MSNDTGMRFWVSDIDGYVDIDAINCDNQAEADAALLEDELNCIGEIPLLAAKSTSARILHRKGVSPSEWRWSLHQAEHALHNNQQWRDLERPFVQELIALGQSYAISRYAKWERLPYSSALTATFPLGLKALINQFLIGEGITRTSLMSDCLQTALKSAEQHSGIAYVRTGILQAAIHQIADQAPSHLGHQVLDREGMRVTLSLARLHFSVSEMKVTSLRQLQSLADMYTTERTALQQSSARPEVINGRPIRFWGLRHMRPLMDLYPFCIRHGVSRGMHHHSAVAEEPDRSIAVNELALANSGILRMRRAGRDRTRSK